MPAPFLSAAASGASPPLQRKHPQASLPWVHPSQGSCSLRLLLWMEFSLQV